MPVPREIAPGLWSWRARHPGWSHDAEWPPDVAAFAVRTRAGVVAVDPIAYPRERLGDPAAVAVLKPDHTRDAAALGAPVYGSAAVAAKLDGVRVVAPGDELPGGLRVLDDGRGKGELWLWAPAPRALIVADGLRTDDRGLLRIWWSERYEERELPALRRLLDLPIAHVLVSHGAPERHDGRPALAAALERAPFGAPA